MHALQVVIFGQGVEYFTISNQHELQSTPSGGLNFRLVDPKSLHPFQSKIPNV